MGAGRGQANDDVPLALVVQARQHLVAVHGPHREAGQVVVAFAVHARHLRRLAADQGRAGQEAALGDARDHPLGHVHVQLGGGVVVEEHQGLGALGQQVVHAHGYQVDADVVVAARFDGDLQLGADPVGGGD